MEISQKININKMEDLEEEEWKDIIGYEGLYQISNKSNFKSLDKTVRGYGNFPRTQKGKMLKKSINSNGYLFITLTKKCVTKRFNTHILVAIHFIPNPNNLKIVEHKDDNKLNDSIDNLMWSTIKNNNINAHYRSSKKQIKAVLQYDLNGNFIARHESIANAQRIFTPNSRGANIMACLSLNSKSKTAYGFVWSYE